MAKNPASSGIFEFGWQADLVAGFFVVIVAEPVMHANT